MNGDLNGDFNRMRMQLLRDGQMPQTQQRQQQPSQGLGLNIQPESQNGWGEQGQNAWGGQHNPATQTHPMPGASQFVDKHSPNAPSDSQGTSDVWATTSANHTKAESPPEQSESSLWSGSPLGGINRSIWSGGKFKDTLTLTAGEARMIWLLWPVPCTALLYLYW